MVELYQSMIATKATVLLRNNIGALLYARKQSQHDLAQWCRHSDVWISTFLSGKSSVKLRDLDRIADFFGLATYQLFQPGIDPLTERRRSVDRRTGRDRRIGHAQRQMLGLSAAIDPYRTSARKGRHEEPSWMAQELRRLTQDHERNVSALLSQIESGRQTAIARGDLPKASKGRRAVRGPDPEKA